MQDAIINQAQLAPLAEPLPRSIWRKILQDQFVDFEKLFASMDRGYDHNDEPKDFAADFALVKKEQAYTKRALRTEADWIRVFSAWEHGVVALYPHRAEELQNYQHMVMDLFRASPLNPLVAIQFDVEARDHYAKKPFHMDDRGQVDFPLLAQLFRAAQPALSSRTLKRTSHSTSSSSSKRADTPCRNWNLGSCRTDPCPNRRKHGVCSVCGETHRARDNESCFTILQARL